MIPVIQMNNLSKLRLHVSLTWLKRVDDPKDKQSTKTALIKVQIYILSALNALPSDILLMLDLSATFDTIYHDILLSRLCNVYGITGDALDWFMSYLTGRKQRVVIEDSVSVDQ